MNTPPIILIDDDSEDLELLREVVNEIEVGRTIFSFTDPVKALDFFSKNKVDAFFILCDLNMPKINGLQLRMEMIAQPFYNRQTPFYLLSTGNTSRERELARGLNVRDYLVKPTSFAGIKATLEGIVETALVKMVLQKMNNRSQANHMKEKKKPVYKPKELSDEACRELEQKYGVPQHTLREMAREMRFGRPKLEMHLIYLATESKKKNK